MSKEGRRETQEVAMKIPPTMQLITSSRLKDARACPRLHRIRYELGYRPAEEPEALRFGTLGHEGLKAWWEAQGDRLEATLTAIRTATHAEAEPDLFALAKAEAMLTGYDARWKAEPYEVLAVEVPFETELRNPMTGRPSQTWRLAGKIDAIVRDLRDGRVLVVEHKTATGDISPGSEYWRAPPDGRAGLRLLRGSARPRLRRGGLPLRCAREAGAPSQRHPGPRRPGREGRPRR
jgi:hypothetical protein